MGRPKAQPFTLGTITTRPHPTLPGQWQARGRYRDHDNRLVSATASGKSAPASRRALQDKVAKAKDQWTGGDASLNQDTTVRAAARLWLDHIERTPSKRGGPRSKSTLDLYRGNVDRYVACMCGPDNPCGRKYALASLTVAQANSVGRIEPWLAEIANNHGKGAATAARMTLTGILGLAAHRGAIPASVLRTHRIDVPTARVGSRGDRKCADEDCDRDCGKRHLDTERVFTEEEIARIMATAEDSPADIADLIAFLYFTGARASEALHHVRWDGIDFEARTIFIDGSKTKAAKRTVPMPPDLAARLKVRAQLHGTKGLVFGITRYPTKMGEPRDKNNVLKALRSVLAAAGVPGTGSHSFRRTLATNMDRASDPLTVIAAQLGHASTQVTHVYLKRSDTLSPSVAAMRLPTLKPDLKAVI